MYKICKCCDHQTKKIFSDKFLEIYECINCRSLMINHLLIKRKDIDKDLGLSYLDKDQNQYLVFNENPLGYYPLIYQDGVRQPIAEIEIFDVIKNNGALLNSNQSKWFSVDNIPF